MSADETFVCAECGDECSIRPSVVTGVTTEDDDTRQLCIDCWSDGTTLVGYNGP